MTTLRDIALLRLVAQRIAGPGSATVPEAVRWMGALQAQDFRGAVTSVALRTQARSAQAVYDALDAGEVVRSWPMRGTLHLIAAEDLPGVLELTAPRMLTSVAARRAALGLDDKVLGRARELTQRALAGGRAMRRKDLLATWNDEGVNTDGQRGYHLLWHLAQQTVVCQGPMLGNEQGFVLVDAWISPPRRVQREAALAAWVARFFRSHGPATAKDAARWTGLPPGEIRTALEIGGDGLERLAVDGVEYLMDPQTPELLAAHRRRAGGLFLLPGFDEYVLGYGDRSAMLPAEHSDRLAPGGNGVFRPTVVKGGRILGTWRATGAGSRRGVEAASFTSFPDTVAAAIPRVFAKLPQPLGPA